MIPAGIRNSIFVYLYVDLLQSLFLVGSDSCMFFHLLGMVVL